MRQRGSFEVLVLTSAGPVMTITGRWMDDGQFIFPYHDYLLGLAAKKAGIKIGTYCL